MIVIQLERELDGRWIGEAMCLPGVMAYGRNRHDAARRTKVLALNVLADCVRTGESIPQLERLFSIRDAAESEC